MAKNKEKRVPEFSETAMKLAETRRSLEEALTLQEEIKAKVDALEPLQASIVARLEETAPLEGIDLPLVELSAGRAAEFGKATATIGSVVREAVALVAEQMEENIRKRDEAMLQAVAEHRQKYQDMINDLGKKFMIEDEINSLLHGREKLRDNVLSEHADMVKTIVDQKKMLLEQSFELTRYRAFCNELRLKVSRVDDLMAKGGGQRLPPAQEESFRRSLYDLNRNILQAVRSFLGMLPKPAPILPVVATEEITPEVPEEAPTQAASEG